MRIIKSLYAWVVLGFIAGCVVGLCWPGIGSQMEPFGTQFIKLIRVFVGPIVFLTVVVGITHTGSLGKLGRVGLKSIAYFELMSTFALAIGWIMASLVKPGAHMNANLADLNKNDQLSAFMHVSDNLTFVKFLEEIIPNSVVGPFASGDMLQILFLAILFGIALLLIDDKYTKGVSNFLKGILESLFQIIKIIMYVSPIGVFGAMAFTVSEFGKETLVHLFLLMLTFYASGIFFVLVVLGTIAYLAGFSIIQFLRYIAPEVFLVLATSSSESALPQLIAKLQKVGCKLETVGVVVPIGYSFNLDGTNIYITLAALFIAQALGIHMSFLEQLLLFLTAMLSSKGAAGVSGAGFVTLAATIAVVPSIPVAGIVLILGIDRFMSEARAIVNFIGNGVASLIVSVWEGEITRREINDRLKKALTS